MVDSPRLDRSDFGPNEWLIDEMYWRFQENPESVGAAWQEFFEDYRPGPELQVPAAAEGSRPQPKVKPEKEREEEEGSEEPPPSGEEVVPLRGAGAVIAARMEESLEVPTATSVRTIPAKLLEINRSILNRHIARKHGSGKVSFTHLIGWAVVQAVARMPGMNVTYRVSADGKPEAVRHEHVNLGLAVDVKRKDGTRTLLVPNIKRADTLDFAAFFERYEELIRKVNSGKVSPDDFSGTTVSITNPGMIGTAQSVPRLMSGQACIVGVGAITYPAEYLGADPQTLAEIGIGKVVTLTSTYDHRVIQGAESGEFLRLIHSSLVGDDGFYEGIFESLGVPYVPVPWRQDVNPAADSDERMQKQ